MPWKRILDDDTADDTCPALRSLHEHYEAKLSSLTAEYEAYTTEYDDLISLLHDGRDALEDLKRVVRDLQLNAPEDRAFLEDILPTLERIARRWREMHHQVEKRRWWLAQHIYVCEFTIGRFLPLYNEDRAREEWLEIDTKNIRKGRHNVSDLVGPPTPPPTPTSFMRILIEDITEIREEEHDLVESMIVVEPEAA